MSKKTKTAADIRAEIDAQKAKLDAMKKALRAQQRAEAKAAAAAKAEADAQLAAALLVKLRGYLPDDTSDAELTAVVERVFALAMDGQPVAEWALAQVREHQSE